MKRSRVDLHVNCYDSDRTRFNRRSFSADLVTLICVSSYALFYCLAVQEWHVMAQEMDTLLKLKESFQNNSGLSSWKATITNSSSNPKSHDPFSHCKGWRGVTCDNTSSYVVGLSLSGLLLGGGGTTTSVANQSTMFTVFLKDLPHLQRLNLSKNKLGGYIPPDLYRLRSLKSLDLSRNRLKGGIPPDGWNNLSSLQFLYLHYNQLTGHIPPQLSQAANLERIVLKRNNLDGPIPEELFGPNLWSLTHFEIDSNNITGGIPEGIGASVSLQSFRASYNRLNGTLPDSIGNLSVLREFIVDHNQLSGPVPASLGDLPNLMVLNLSYNDFTGPVSTNISRFNASSFLGNPSLCGPPPLENACPSVSPPKPPEADHEPPKPPDRDNRNKPKRRNQHIVLIAIVASVVGVALLVLVFVLVYRHRRRRPMNHESNNWFGSGIDNVRSQGQFIAYRQSFNKYAYEELVANAGHFDTAHVLGKGRFATVYKAILPDGMAMAIKVFKHANMHPNFEKYLDSLALLKHKNLLIIRGFFSSPHEKAILYDYLPFGTLHKLLHIEVDQWKHLLDWPTRHKIALGVAQAMVYLHGNKVLHWDLKSTNILLQDTFVPKVSDFGLIHIVSDNCGGNEVSTHDCVAPEVRVLANSNPIKKNFTEKSDVYSYGMVLLELITSQKATSNLREKVMHMDKEGRGRDAMDPFVLQSCLWPEYMDKALSLAILCVSESPSSRPTMVDIVSILDGLCPILSPLKSPHSDSP